jgi:hypothetical protein
VKLKTAPSLPMPAIERIERRLKEATRLRRRKVQSTARRKR